MATDSEKRILIIEDASDIRYLLKGLFEGEGFSVDQAGNGQEALDLLQNMSALPQLILLDLGMPVMDGYEFRAKQEMDPRLSAIPVVVMTADGDVNAKKNRLRAKEFLKKPVDIHRLLTIARSTLEMT
jgi:CheY-like chemotaxis protein